MKYLDDLLSPMPYKFEEGAFDGIQDFDGYSNYDYETTYRGNFQCQNLSVGFTMIHNLAKALAKDIGLGKR